METGFITNTNCTHCKKLKICIMVSVFDSTGESIDLCKKCLQKFRDEIIKYEAS